MASKIRVRRLRAKLSQGELARRSGMTQAAISNLEAGKRVPRLDSLKKLASALHCQLTELI